MANFSDWAESGVLNWLFRGNTNNFGRPATLAVALCSGVPTETNNGGNIPEIANAGGYARVNLGAPANSIFSECAQVSNSGNINNANTITFPVATADWGMVSGVAITDSGVYGSGNVIVYGFLQTARDVRNGDTFTFSAANLSLYLG